MCIRDSNIALLYQEMGNYEKAAQHLKKALAIIEKIPGAEIEVATTLSNLGASLLEIEEIQEAEECLNKALEIFKKDTVKNFHYSAALSAICLLYTSSKRICQQLCKISIYDLPDSDKVQR